MSRSKQETVLLEERIEKIRRKNEEIRRRHEEVEADKQNAAKLNALVQVSAPTEDWTTGGKLQTHHQSSAKVKFAEQQQHQEGSERGRSKEQTEYMRPQSGPNAKKPGSAKCYSFQEGDGPPPDPSYRFLADAERDRERSFQTGRRGRGAAHQRGSFTRERGRGGSNYRGGHSNGGRPEGDASRAEYDAWRAERNRIDSDRINRQKTAEGQWRREWDNEKIVQEEDEIKITVRDAKYSTPRRNDRRTYNENIRNSPKENYRYSGGSDEGTSRTQENMTERGGGNRKGEKQNRSVPQEYKPVSFQPNTPPKRESTSDSWDDEGPKRTDRSVITIGESIKICIRNSSSPAVSTGSTVKSVKVNPPVIAGTGRVGPRQRIRVSYSSQSEDEAVQQAPRSRPPRSVQQHQNARSVHAQSGNSSASPKTSQVLSQPEFKPDSLHEQSSVEPAPSKPPLPPLSVLKHESSYPKPRRQRNRKLENERVKKNSKASETASGASQEQEKENKEDNQKVDDIDKSTGNDSECGGDGDDSWEDITTTSGNESVSEYPDEGHSPNKKSSLRSVTFKESDNIRICFQNNENEEIHDSDGEKLPIENEDHSHIELQESTNLCISINISENVDNEGLSTSTELKSGDEDNENGTYASPNTNKEERYDIVVSSVKNEGGECQRVEIFDKEKPNIASESQEITLEEKQPETVSRELLDVEPQSIIINDQQLGESAIEKAECVNENIPVSTCVEGEKASESKDSADQGDV